MLNQINPKIEWYQEVLSLEPSSRVFFALAKLLSQDGNEKEAIEVLKKGLVYHPEYIEAKLFLFELHQNTNQSSDNLSELTQVFTSYPKFWTAWSEQEANNLDLSCTLGLLGLILKQDQVSIQSIILAGINALSSDDNKIVTDKQTTLSKQTSPSQNIENQENKAESQVELNLLPETKSLEAEASYKDIELFKVELLDSEENPDLKCSTYTRSMAELLAEQGDINGALNILEKLLVSHSASDDILGISDIKKRIETLSSYSQASNSSKTEENTSFNENLEPKESSKDKTKQNKTVAFLSNLASRLEARSLNARNIETRSLSANI